MKFMEFDKINDKNDKIDERLLDENNNPLKNVPMSKKRLYVYVELLRNVCFDKKEKLDKYVKTNKQVRGETATVDYLGNMAGKDDVIRITYDSDHLVKYISVVDSLGYVVYNEKKSIAFGQYVWDYEYGEIKDIIMAFKKLGVEIKNDVYSEIDDIYSSVGTFVEPLKRR